MKAKATELLAELGAHAHAGTLTRTIFDEAYAEIEKLVPADSLESPDVFEALGVLEQSITPDK